MLRKAIAEFTGTFFLVFAGTGAIVINEVSGGQVTHVGVSLVFGLIVVAVIESFGNISEAHINPAVSVAFTVAGKMKISECIVYIPAQLAGAFTASFVLQLLFPSSLNLGGTRPSGSDMQSFILEIILSFMLMLVILRVATGAKERGLPAAVTIGFVVLLEAMFAGPITGASMNPARSLAPAMLTNATDKIWIYISAPIIGMLAAVLFDKKILK